MIILIIVVTSIWVYFDAKKLMKNIPTETRYVTINNLFLTFFGHRCNI